MNTQVCERDTPLGPLTAETIRRAVLRSSRWSTFESSCNRMIFGKAGCGRRDSILGLRPEPSFDVDSSVKLSERGVREANYRIGLRSTDNDRRPVTDRGEQHR